MFMFPSIFICKCELIKVPIFMGRLPIFEPPNDLVAGSIYHEILSLTVSAALYLATFEFISKNQSNLCKKLQQDGLKDRQY